MTDVKSLNNLISNIREVIAYFKDKNNESKKKFNNCKTLSTILKK